MSAPRRILLSLVVGVLVASPAMAGLVVHDLSEGLTATAMATALAGNDAATVANVTFTGDTTAAGTFTGGGPTIGIDQGIVLSSGRVTSMVGANASGGTSTSFGNPGDSALGALIGGPTFDAATLEFDVTPASSPLVFTYVFASDEYSESVGSRFDDGMGLFVDGTNNAFLPVGSQPPVSIDTVNGGRPVGTNASNPEFFVNNEPPAASIAIQADGFTKLLTATAAVAPGVRHHVKISIADGGDSGVDSWVMIGTGAVVGGPAPDLAITATCPTGAASIGEEVSFPLRYRNLGPGQADDVTITAFPPVGWKFVRSDPPICAGHGLARSCAVGALPPAGPEGHLTIVARPDLTGVGTAVARISSAASTDPNHGNDEVSCPVAVGVPAPLASVDLTVGTGAGACGRVMDGVNATGTQLLSLQCGDLNLGGGSSTQRGSPLPDGTAMRLCLAECGSGGQCTITPSVLPAIGVGCSMFGCPFGPPLPVPNGGVSTCLANQFAGAAGGSINTLSGANDITLPLRSQIFLTGNAGAPCPSCRAGGVSGLPCAGNPQTACTGVCDRGAKAGETCTSTNSQGLSGDCQPGGSDAGHPCGEDPSSSSCKDGSVNLGTIDLDVPLTTGTSVRSDANGLLCPGQDGSDDPSLRYPGCFGTTSADLSSPLCRSIVVQGQPAGPLLPKSATPVTLASAFCVPKTSSSLLNFALALPGPGEVSLPGTLRVTDATSSCPAPVTVPTTTSTTMAPTCGNGFVDVDLGEECDLGGLNGAAAESCCDANCHLLPPTAVCRSSQTTCVADAVCVSADGTCPASVVASGGTPCVSGGTCTTGDVCRAGKCEPSTKICNATARATQKKAKLPRLKVVCGLSAADQRQARCSVAAFIDASTLVASIANERAPRRCSAVAGKAVAQCRGVAYCTHDAAALGRKRVRVVPCRPTRCGSALAEVLTACHAGSLIGGPRVRVVTTFTGLQTGSRCQSGRRTGCGPPPFRAISRTVCNVCVGESCQPAALEECR